jgi:hypothetical protein
MCGAAPQDAYKPDVDHIVTAASCTTNCLAPVVKVVHEKLGIKHGCITTIHNITNTQTIVDAPNTKKSDLRRARCVLVCKHCSLADIHKIDPVWSLAERGRRVEGRGGVAKVVHEKWGIKKDRPAASEVRVVEIALLSYRLWQSLCADHHAVLFVRGREGPTTPQFAASDLVPPQPVPGLDCSLLLNFVAGLVWSTLPPPVPAVLQPLPSQLLHPHPTPFPIACVLFCQERGA